MIAASSASAATIPATAHPTVPSPNAWSTSAVERNAAPIPFAKRSGRGILRARRKEARRDERVEEPQDDVAARAERERRREVERGQREERGRAGHERGDDEQASRGLREAGGTLVHRGAPSGARDETRISGEVGG